jgi:hypothetical protein
MLVGLCASCILKLDAAKQMTKAITADALAGMVADEKALPTVRLDALKELFSRHFKPHGTLAETAGFFKLCHWIKKEDWEVVLAFAGSWPFEDDDIFSATPERTRLVALRMRPKGSAENGMGMAWLAFPQGEKIVEEEIELILSGKCPGRLEKIHLLDGVLESD